jgi:hypothetical protein
MTSRLAAGAAVFHCLLACCLLACLLMPDRAWGDAPASTPANPATPTPTASPSPAADAASPSASPSPAGNTGHDLNAPAHPVRGVFFTEEVRLMPESYDYFSPSPKYENAYGYFGMRLRGGVGYSAPSYGARLELANVLLAGLPEHAIAPGAAGSLGQGGTYFSLARRDSIDTLGVRQLYFRGGAPEGKLGAPTGSDVQIGRLEYESGLEAPSTDTVLDWVKRERLSRKIIGEPDYNIWSRTFDGIRFDVDSDAVRFTGFVAHPTQAEPHFAVDAHDVTTANAALTFKQGGWMQGGEGQIYFNVLDDTRQVAQADNSGVKGSIRGEGGDHIYTTGFQYVTHLGRDGDAAIWYGHQSGHWGPQTQNANAYTAELGWRLPDVPWQPWFRLGYSLYSGDDNPHDKVHGTWVAELSDPRVRYNVYTFANLRDPIAEVVVTPSKNWSARIDAHFLSLDSAKDLWYAGSGVTQEAGVSGFSGRPSGGSSALGPEIEVFVSRKVNDFSTIQLRVIEALGQSVVRHTYPTKTTGSVLWVEYHLSR